MGKAVIDELRTQVLGLSSEDRAELARDLLISLDGPADPGAEEAWNREILRRLDDIEAGRVNLLDADEVMQRVRKRLAQA